MVIETIQELEQVFSADRLAAVVIPGSNKFHPYLTSAVGLFIASGENRYIIPIDHPDGINMSIFTVQTFLSTVPEVFVPNKKDFLYFFGGGKNIKDLKFAGFTLSDNKVSINGWMENKYHNHPEVNKMIPLVKHLEKLTLDFKGVENVVEKFKPDQAFGFYNDIASPVFHLAERHGLRTIYQPYVDLFKPADPVFNTSNNITYTYYNLYNATSRPTNAFNSVNFAAIPKKEEYRKCFIPQNDIFVEFDFDGYHLRLIADQIGYPLTSESAHTQLAREYFGTENISAEDYARAKQINFQALYGNIPSELKDFKLFNQLEKYTEDLWGQFVANGSVNAPISGKVFSVKDHPDMNPKKLLNYIIQSLETSRNILILKDVFRYLQNKETKVALYTYDSVLFDFSKKDGRQTLEDLERILSEDGKYPVKFKYSNNMFFQN